MNYIYVSSPEPVIEYLTNLLKEKLGSGAKVLWLLSGGSGANVCVEVSKRLFGTNLHNLSVTLSDERYGPVGHANENWQILLDAGLKLPGATMYRPLIGMDRASTTVQFSSWLKDELDNVDFTVGLIGIGSDGHTAGLKPHTVIIDTTDFATDFTGDDFERITMTSTAIAELDEAVIQAMGADKAPTLQKLMNQDINPNEQPAQLLKTVPKVTLFTDYKEK